MHIAYVDHLHIQGATRHLGDESKYEINTCCRNPIRAEPIRAEQVTCSISMVTSFDSPTSAFLSMGLRLGWPDPWPQDLAC